MAQCHNMAHSHYCVKKDSWLYAIMTERKPQNMDKFIVRLPNGMRERIKASASQNNRSMNAELVAVLAEKFPEPELQYAFLFQRVLQALKLPKNERRLQLDKLAAECAGFGIELVISQEGRVSFQLDALSQDD